jgi:hypothetical protein
LQVSHTSSAAELLQSIATLEAAIESEQRHAAASPKVWVFNWRAEGWVDGEFESERHEFGDEVAVYCLFSNSSTTEQSHFIGLRISDFQWKVHATFSILDKHDKTLRQVCELGTATEPYKFNHNDDDDDDDDDDEDDGIDFTPTPEDLAQSVRADGSIRLRAVVRLFLD